MFHRKPEAVTAPPTHVDVDPPEELIPLSVLALDLPAPADWSAFLADRGVHIVLDDLGRSAVSRADARRLFDERRENEARNREAMERREAQLIQQDRLRRASLPTGIPAVMVPDGLRPAEAMMLAGESSAPRAMSVREQLLQRELAHRSEPELIYQSIGPDEG
jgi:hypothetical protein